MHRYIQFNAHARTHSLIEELIKEVEYADNQKVVNILGT